MTDDELDALLARAGERWREDNTSVAISPSEAITFELDTQPATPHRARPHTWQWAVGVAAVVALAAGIVIAVRPGSSGSHNTGTSTGVATSSLVGPKWTLVSYLTAAGQSHPVGRYADYLQAGYLQIDAQGQIQGSDSCNSFKGPARIKGDRLAVDGLRQTAAGCPEGVPSVFDGVLGVDGDQSLATTTWSITGDRLTLSRPGFGSLVFNTTPTPSSSSSGWVLYSPVGIQALTGTWRLSQTTDGSSASAYSWSSQDSAPALVFTEIGTTPVGNVAHLYFFGNVTGTDGCNAFVGSEEITATTLSMNTAIRNPKPCPSMSSDIQQLLQSTTLGWSVSGDTLTLTSGNKGLVYDRQSIPAPPSARTSATTSATPINGTSWQLNSWTWSKSSGVVGTGLSLAFGLDGTFTSTDDCVRVTGHTDFEGTQVTLSEVAWANLGCTSIDPALAAEKQLLVDGTLNWSYQTSGSLVLRTTQSGGVPLLSFVNPAAEAGLPAPATAFVGTSWARQASPGSGVGLGTAVSALSFSTDGKVTVRDSCGQATGQVSVQEATLSITWTDNHSAACTGTASQVRAVLDTNSVRWSMTDLQGLSLANGTQVLNYTRTK